MKLSTVLSRKWIKHPKPILYPGEIGAWDDLMVDCPDVLTDGTGRYYLFYTGHSTRTHKWAIGFAGSKDLYNLEKYNGNPILEQDDAGWDKRIDGATVFKHDDRYYLFYEATSSFSLSKSRFASFLPYPIRKGLGGLRRWVRFFSSTLPSQAVEHAHGRAIGFAVSDDLKHWTKHMGNPVLMRSNKGWDSCGVFSPCVQYANGLFHLFYGGSDGVRIHSGLATSNDLANWTRLEEPVLEAGPLGSWDDASLLIVSIIRLEDAYVAFYEGQDRLNNYAIGVAYSNDLRRWTKFEGNPVITKGQVGSADEKYVNSPHGFIEGERAYIFYGALDGKLRGRSMVAYLDGCE